MNHEDMVNYNMSLISSETHLVSYTLTGRGPIGFVRLIFSPRNYKGANQKQSLNYSWEQEKFN